MAENIIGKLFKGFGLWRKNSKIPEISNPRGDVLCKLNLAPLMGRRDAAFDCVESIGSPEFLRCSDTTRLQVYKQAMAQLEAAVADCTRIAGAMTSTDSLRRERSLAGFLDTMCGQLNVMVDLVELSSKVVNGIVVSGGLIEAASASDIAESGIAFHDAEVNFTGRFRSMFERVKPRVLRYREYTRRSFSPENAERYIKAYGYYTEVYKLPVSGR